MPPDASPDPDSRLLLGVIRAQSDIARLGPDLGAVLDVAAEHALLLTGADGSAVELAEGEDMVYRGAAGSARRLLGMHLRRDASLSGLAVADGRSLRCDDAETDPRVDRAACRNAGLRSMIVVPLRHQDAIIGALKVYSSQPAFFDETAMATLDLLAQLVGSALFHAARDVPAELLYRATHDPLTGLANRALFHERLLRLIKHTAPEREALAVVFMDMDGLKAINDRHGHGVGDAALVEFAERIRTAARRVDVCARLGGDEFAVILPHVSNRDVATRVERRLCEAVERPFPFEGGTVAIAASSGLAMYPEDGSDAATLVEHADRAMYEVKRERRPGP
jgi:diguanylate cyclase (GGDEF)-like protein